MDSPPAQLPDPATQPDLADEPGANWLPGFDAGAGEAIPAAADAPPLTRTAAEPVPAAPRDDQAAGSPRYRRPVPRLRPALPRSSKPLVSPRLKADPRFGIWVSRTIIACGILLVVTIATNWWISLPATAIYLAADVVLRSRTMKVIPPSVRVTAAQRATRRRLRVQQPAGYQSLHARTVPGDKAGTISVIDHIVVGPAGVFVLDSQLLDRRLPVRAIGGMLYHGPVKQDGRLEHASWEARTAARKISDELGRPIKAQPVMVTYGPRIPWVVMTLAAVDVIEGSRVSTYFRRQSRATLGRHLTAGQIAEILGAAARTMPPIEEAQAGG